VRLPHLPAPVLLLSVVYTAALAVAIGDPGRHALAGLAVLAGLTARWGMRCRRPGRLPPAVAVVDTATAVDAVLPPAPPSAPVHAAAA
jgi:hypothetical protein